MNMPPFVNKLVKTLITAPLIVGSMCASAAMVEVNYAATVDSTYGDGAGYSVGDFLSGTLVIDTDLAPANYYANGSYSNVLGSYYQTNTNGGDFVSGAGGSDSGLYDQVYLEDEWSGRDYFYVMDRDYSSTYVNSSNYSNDQSYVQVYSYDYVLDFIQGTGLNQAFNLDAGDADVMRGSVYNYSNVIENGVQTEYNNGYANFNLTSLSVGPAAVPDPGTLALLSLGLIGLGATRKKTRSYKA